LFVNRYKSNNIERIANIAKLFIGRFSGELTVEENAILDNWLAENEENPILLDDLKNNDKLTKDLEEYAQYDILRLKKKIDRRIKQRKYKQRSIRPILWLKPVYLFRMGTIAAVSLLIALLYFFSVHNHFSRRGFTKKEFVKTLKGIPPGSSKAMLTLSNGRQLALGIGATGVIKDSNQVILSQAGRLTYTLGVHDVKNTGYNRVLTPKGGQFQIKLSDGTTVWLNAASEISYPATFTGAQREVYVAGEVYFEVARDKIHPFVVKGMNDPFSVQVTGTHFNINTYKDEGAVKITLLEGGVKITNIGKTCILKPGEQVQVTSNGINIKGDINLEEVIAWKNGEFDFGEKASIESIMKQLDRWYDLDVEYQGQVSDFFWGSISRDTDAMQVFKMLAETGAVKFKIERKKVIVMPNY
jgi:transmembrane sensor